MTRPLVLRHAEPIDQLSVLAVQIRQAHNEVEAHTRRSIESMITAGLALLAAKELLKDQHEDHDRLPALRQSIHPDPGNRPLLLGPVPGRIQPGKG
jgi:hypothetical protein